tara:strand:+ start:934 stop:1104 length:171 start_codon:yes stop_codon:yes gene_type:complete
MNKKFQTLEASDQKFLNRYVDSILLGKLPIELFMQMQEWESRNGDFSDYIGDDLDQ